MANWKVSVGNLISRASAVAAAGTGSTADAYYPFENFGDGYPDTPSRWQWEADGIYIAEFDLNFLETGSDRVDAPTGWRDLALVLAFTPGLSANPPVLGTFGTRADTIETVRPVFQDVDVQPGEDVLFEAGLRLPSGSTATGVQVIVLDLRTGEKWDGTDSEWNNDVDPTASHAADSWLDVSIPIVNVSDEMTTYRVILVPVAAAYDATTNVWISTPSLTAAQDFVALIGHNIPAGATLVWTDGSAPRTFSPIGWPSAFETGTSSSKRAWTLTVTLPSNTLAYHQAPYIGELWAGRLSDLVPCPIYPFEIDEADLSQERLEGGAGRISVVSTLAPLVRPNRKVKIKFQATNLDDYASARDSFYRACRYGADPALIAPVDGLEGASVLFHGRIAQEAQFITNRNKRTFDTELLESPFPRFR